MLTVQGISHIVIALPGCLVSRHHMGGYPVAIHSQNTKRNLKILAMLLVDLPQLHIALTSHSSASRRVLLLSDLCLQVCII